MAKQEKALFGLKDFKISNFSYRESEKDKPEIELNFDVKGSFDKEHSLYELSLTVEGVENEENQIFQTTILGLFSFSTKLTKEDIPEYFYANAIAIIFPYLRAFVSTLTLQTNSGLIILDTLNLTQLKDTLKVNTVVK